MSQKTEQDKGLIILTAGGTGGHVYPAEALAEELSKRGYKLALVTDTRGKNNYRGTLGEIPNYAVLAGGMVGKSYWFKIQSLIKIAVGTLQACWILLKEKPLCVVGFGGYASFPCAMAAVLLRKKLILHEQNSVMSRTNRFLSKYACFVAQSFSKVKYAPTTVKNIRTGMPIRRNIAALHTEEYKITSDKFQILILGGSQGAKIFRNVLPSALSGLSAEKKALLKIYQQCRQDDVEELKKDYKDIKIDITISHFFDNMAELYKNSQLIISRAGASSVSEIAAAGLPSILVPLPTAADNHQSTNAEELKKQQAAIVVDQTKFTARWLEEELNRLIDSPQILKQMSANAKAIAITNAAERLADSIEQESLVSSTGEKDVQSV